MIIPVEYRVNRSALVRDWSCPFTINQNDFAKVIQTCLEGFPNFEVLTPYTNVVLFGQPKSASLYMERFLGLCLGFKNIQIGWNHAGGELYYPRLLLTKYQNTNTISHCHATPTVSNRTIVKNLNIKPVVLTRNLLDSLASRYDMLIKDGSASTFGSSAATAHFFNSDIEERLNVIIDLFAWSYINFRSSWYSKEETKDLYPVYITYEEMLEDDVNMMIRTCKEIGFEITAEKVECIRYQIEAFGGINFNKGRPGRGKEMFKSSHIERLRTAARRTGCSDEIYLGFTL